MWTLLRFLSLLTAAAVMTSLVSQHTLVTASVCPLDLSWSNFTSVASACSDPDEVAKCCRYINALIAVSVARYASMTGQLGVPNTFSEMCINSVSETLGLHGISSKFMMFCGLGTKILVNYQCRGRKTILEMLQSANFTDVVINCKMPVSLDSVCRRCINSEISYLHHLLGTEDSVTFSMCRNAVFVSLINHGDQASVIDLARCLFGIKYLGILPVNISGSPPLLSPKGSPSPLLAESPSHHLIGMPAKEHHHSYKLTLIQCIGIGVIGGAVLLLIILILLIYSKNRELKDVAGPMETSARILLRSGWRCHEGPPSIFQMYSYKETKKATCNFSSILGKGGFGTVYKAQFSDGLVAAVKRMDKIPQQGKDVFCRELELLGRLHHRHLVALKGFCVDKHERFLVYEYMENGSLKDHIHSPGKSPLSWETRMQIAIDVANALEYLHFYCDPPLCHRDIKSSNILLDENFVAKVADFGLAHACRSSSMNFEPVNTNISGTPGYLDPEYVVTHELTEKSDIYSYGVLLLELITGRWAIQDNRNLVEWSRKFMGIDSQLFDMVDQQIADSLDPEQLHVIVRIIQWCTQGEGRARPSIKHVLRMLHEGLDPAQFRLNFEDHDDGTFSGSDIYKDRLRPSMAIPNSGDARCFMSSSSTSRSYCSRSLLLESGSPHSGHLSA